MHAGKKMPPLCPPQSHATGGGPVSRLGVVPAGVMDSDSGRSSPAPGLDLSAPAPRRWYCLAKVLDGGGVAAATEEEADVLASKLRPEDVRECNSPALSLDAAVPGPDSPETSVHGAVVFRCVPASKQGGPCDHCATTGAWRAGEVQGDDSPAGTPTRRANGEPPRRRPATAVGRHGTRAGVGQVQAGGSAEGAAGRHSICDGCAHECKGPDSAFPPHLHLRCPPRTESPQWRRGPAVKPVLCNACGTRFRRTGQLHQRSPVATPAPPPPRPSDLLVLSVKKQRLSVSLEECVLVRC